ncbi:MAG TPA: hypothetical protein VIH21_06775, partial [Dehalococcoidia bacterium]
MIEQTASKPQTVSGLRVPRLSLSVLALGASVALVIAMATLSVVDDGGPWAEALAAVGIGAMVFAIAIVLGSSRNWADGAGVSLLGISTAVVGIGAVALAVVMYAGGSGSSSSPSDGSNVTNGGNGGPSSNSVVASPNDDHDGDAEGAALSQQVSNNEVQPPGYAHDVGSHPRFDDFMSMENAALLASVPGGTLLPNEVDGLKGELAAARQFAEEHNTVEKAQAAGFYNTTNDVPFMGAHFINSDYLTDGVFDAGKPEGLLFSRLGDPSGEWQLVGVWYLLLPGQAGATVSTPPEGFAGNLDLWHTHYGLCTRAGIISENN